MALDSMQEIFEKMQEGQKPFWKVVQDTDVEERQVTPEASLKKLQHDPEGHAGNGGHVSGRSPFPQWPGGRRRPADGGICCLRQGPGWRLSQSGHYPGPVHGGVQRLYAKDRGSTHGGRLRRVARSPDPPVSPGGARGGNCAGTVRGGGHWCCYRISGLHCRRLRRMPGGDRLGLCHGGRNADSHPGAAARSRSDMPPLWL